MVDIGTLFGVVLLDLVDRGLRGLYLGVDLSGAEAAVDRFADGGERLVFLRDQLDDRQHRDQAAVRVPVVAEVEVTGVLAAEDGVFLAHQSLDKGVADAGPDSPATVLLADLGHRPRADQVVDDRRPRLLLQHLQRDHRRGRVTAYEPTVLVDQEPAVGIAVEGNTEVATLLDNRAL